jgi:hypothetical protein
MDRIDELITEQRKTNALLERLIESRAISHPPISREPTVGEEIAAVRAQGISLADYLVQKSRRGICKKNKNQNGTRHSNKQNSEHKKT